MKIEQNMFLWSIISRCIQCKCSFALCMVFPFRLLRLLLHLHHHLYLHLLHLSFFLHLHLHLHLSLLCPHLLVLFFIFIFIFIIVLWFFFSSFVERINNSRSECVSALFKWGLLLHCRVVFFSPRCCFLRINFCCCCCCCCCCGCFVFYLVGWFIDCSLCFCVFLFFRMQQKQLNFSFHLIWWQWTRKKKKRGIQSCWLFWLFLCFVILVISGIVSSSPCSLLIPCLFCFQLFLYFSIAFCLFFGCSYRFFVIENRNEIISQALQCVSTFMERKMCSWCIWACLFFFQQQ